MINNYIEHPWLKDYPIKPNHKHLIIGTHPPMPYNGLMAFYYGNMNEFWRLLELTYEQELFFSQQGVPELMRIQKWLDEKQVAITDMVQYTCNAFSTDQEMKIQSDDQLNQNLQKWLENSTIDNIFFTSFSNGNSAYGLFRRWYRKTYRIRLPQGIEVINQGNSETITINGRKIRLWMLYSPSPAARRGIPRSLPYIKWLALNPYIVSPIDAFRVFWYRRYFKKLVK
jgi:G:T/U-mismatch repair DNA glycosylase